MARDGRVLHHSKQYWREKTSKYFDIKSLNWWLGLWAWMRARVVQILLFLLLLFFFKKLYKAEGIELTLVILLTIIIIILSTGPLTTRGE